MGVKQSRKPAARVAFRVRDARGEDVYIASDKRHALVRAQDIALRHDGETELRVWMYPTYGERELVYRVVRDEGGTVFTCIVNDAD